MITIALNNYLNNYTGLTRICWLGIFLTFIEAIAMGVCFFLSLYFVNELHINVALAGGLVSCYGVGTVLGGLIFGKLTDKYSSKIISTLSLLIQSFAFFLLAEPHSIVFLSPTLFLLGFSTYGFLTANDVWILRQCGDNSQLRLKTLNISRVALNLGLGLSGVIIGLIAETGFRNIFYLFGGLLLISSLYLFLQKNIAHNTIQPQIEVGLIKVRNQTKSSQKVMRLILVCVFLVGLLIAQLSATYPLYIQNTFSSLGYKAVSILFILDTVLIVLFQAPLVNFFNDYNKIIIVGVGAFLMGIGMLVLSFSHFFILGIISCVIWTTGEMLFIPVAQLICYEKSSENKKGSGMGLYKTAYASSKVLGPTIGAFIYQNYSGEMLWYLSASIGLICLIACYAYRKHT